MFDLAIIGGGPAGYTAAERAAHNGLNVVVVMNKFVTLRDKNLNLNNKK